MRAKAGIAAVAGLFLLVASCSSDIPSDNNPSGSAGTKASTAGTGGVGGMGATSCAAGLLSCGSACVNAQTDAANCGACGTKCGDGQSCVAGKCSCSSGLTSCGATCANLTSDGNNCGACSAACGAMFCSQSKCSATCATGEEMCGNSCVVKATDPTNCGVCGNRCPGGASCAAGACSCGAGKATCGGACVDVSADAANCGACGKACAAGQTCSGSVCSGSGTGGTTGAGGTGTAGTGTGGSGPVVSRANGCAVKPGMIADFEDGQPMPIVIASEGRTGTMAPFSDKTVADPTVTIEPSGGTADCDKNAVHVKGSGYTDWGAGVSMNLAGTAEAPTPYNAKAQNFTGISFKAKLGSGHDAKSSVRFNIATPWTESKDNPGGQCSPAMATDNKAYVDCYQHAGKFLAPGTGDQDLTQSWKTFNFCFDRDLYPLSLPSNLTNDQRNNIATNMLKVQFQFNQGKDYSVPYTTTYPPFDKKLPFDFWVDDVTFFSGACPNMVVSPSNGSPAKPFPQNAAVGSCMPATGAANFADAITKIYANWKKNFVQTDKIVAPEQQNAVTSEAMGYGMLIAAAMGDKAQFDKFRSYVNSHSSGGLMVWKDSGASGSASDADMDIAYALLMAGKQWGGDYAAAGNTMASVLGNTSTGDLDSSGVVRGGTTFRDAQFNASYFAPAAFRAFGSSFASAITKNYQLVNANITAGTSGVPTDWANPSSGAPSGPGSAQVTSEIVDGDNGAMGYDSARVSWRLGLDACLGGGNTTGLKAIVDFFAAKYDAGASIDLMKAGWYKKTGLVHSKAKDMQGSYIGPMGVGGMAMGNKAMQDRAVRVLLDILESGDYNHTYFPSTVGLFTLLAMTGNFPTP